ncbi:MAG: SGNH/GDSL hydrolase family protein [Comamonadaceae bacterium]|nr:MAG: SGNH/GDSL hydrolase family protein [Comamonadaceae bacterium]
MTALKSTLFRIVAVLPVGLLILGMAFLAWGTDFPQRLYLAAIVNFNFDCVEHVEEDYVYRMRRGFCEVANLEYRTATTHDKNGRRNPDGAADADYEIVVIGDSHAYGFGVDDAETFSQLLARERRKRIYNLAVGSYSTKRELASLVKHTKNEKIIILQYCDNDYRENLAALRTDNASFVSTVRSNWRMIEEHYRTGKEKGVIVPLFFAARSLKRLDFQSKSAFYAEAERRDIAGEAEAFARVVAQYKNVLTGKKLIVFESSAHGKNARGFKAAFDAALKTHAAGTDFTVLDSSSFLTHDDYYFLDDHPTKEGHRKIAQQLAPLL